MKRPTTTLGELFGDVFKRLKRHVDVMPAAEPAVPMKRKTEQDVRPLKPSEPSKAKANRGRPSRPTKSARRKLREELVAVSKRGKLDLGVYRGATPSHAKPIVQRAALNDLSADMAKLVIRAAKSQASISQSLPPVMADGSRTAILGLDFGTAFTKAVIRFQGDHYVVNWSGAVTTSDPYLMPSSFSEHEDGNVVLGIRQGPGWSHCDGIKMRLLAADSANDCEAQCDAVLFIAAAFKYASAWFSKVSKDADSPRWRLHLGLPAESWDDESMASRFRILALAGRNLACLSELPTRERAKLSLHTALTAPSSSVAVLPEFACQLYSYLSSAQRQSDMHALMDIGAGTLDMAFFNVHKDEEGDVLPIFSAVVKNLGTHFLIGAMAGKTGERLVWRDGDAAAEDQDVAERVGEKRGDVSQRRGAYLSALARTFNEARERSRILNPTSRVWRDQEPLDLFLCGGGSRLPTIVEHVRLFVREAKGVCGLSIRVNSLPRPQNLVGDMADDQYDRVSVAYGLSQVPGNVGKVIRRHDLEPFEMSSGREIEDRDATR